MLHLTGLALRIDLSIGGPKLREGNDPQRSAEELSQDTGQGSFACVLNRIATVRELHAQDCGFREGDEDNPQSAFARRKKDHWLGRSMALPGSKKTSSGLASIRKVLGNSACHLMPGHVVRLVRDDHGTHCPSEV